MEIKTAQIITNEHRLMHECFANLIASNEKMLKELRELKKEIKALKPVEEEVKKVETNITSKKGK